ncbi:hypothetical protein HYDPIDRAFT_112799 [Hydnomerulius pinastri MD-312]|uniref:Aminotransferase class I/classII large domain-containing protein n=1 Tax=Hydnomerulius pinastri MD-312 TaxID=994086 RepID=A0A0C9VZG2_9AGAM|nr:hypothetical protein HYDPIDRAFT_112799 [Hydnomerulius pinastri MD-312]
MSQESPLHHALQLAVAHRAQTGMTHFSLDEPLPSSAPDLFSNDYLSLSTDAILRESFIHQALAAPQLFGSTGSRLGTGNSEAYNALERKLERFFEAPSALLFSSGFSANSAFFASVPQSDDVIIYDELVHTSCREGFRMSSARDALYRFAHNSVASFEDCLQRVLRKHPQIIHGNSTVFISLESLYSMDGDFCPLAEIVQLVEDLVPAGHAHIVVDEAHTSGICGPNGSGYVSLLGLNHRVHTKVHTFGKAWGFHGAVVLTSPTVREYLVNFAKSVIFSTSMPYTDIYALHCCLDVISSERGQELRQSLNQMARYAHKQLTNALRHVPDGILCLEPSSSVVENSGPCSPIIPIFTPLAQNLADCLLEKGYGVTPMTYPIVRRPRIRMIAHARNTEEDIDSFINTIVQWALRQDAGPLVVRGVEGRYHDVEARARL